MDSFSEELSRQTYGFMVIQVTVCMLGFISEVREDRAVRAFHPSNHPKQRVLPPRILGSVGIFHENGVC